MLTGAFRELARQTELLALDVGARSGVFEDLLPIASSVEVVGLEPDREECERLARDAEREPGPWRRLRILPYALGTPGPAELKIYRWQGCSSLLEPNESFVRRMGRQSWFEVLDRRTLELTSLDGFVDVELQEVHVLKLDTQGTELDILRSGPRALESILGIRIEVEFAPLYRDQPLFTDVDGFLRERDFRFWGFLESHAWRDRAGLGPTRVSDSGIWWSRGRWIHGDALYLKRPELLVEDARSAVRGALVALCYGLFDEARWILEESGAWQAAQTGRSLTKELDRISRRAHRQHLLATGRAGLRNVRDILRSSLRRWLPRLDPTGTPR